MPIRTVILDFDGTCTDVEREAEGFLVRYKQDLAGVLGREDIQGAWAAAEAAVLAEPARHGMVIGGLLVAPPVDPYLLATSISAALEPDLPDSETERLFKENYRYTTTAFKPEACAVVEALAAADVHFFIVTNSDPATVGSKLDTLGPIGRASIRLHGDARKFLVTEPDVHAGSARFAAVAATHAVEGWARPIHTRRGHYFDALESIWRETDTTPHDTLVVGDVFELDLVLPGMLGCQLHLAAGSRTLAYERVGTEAFGGTHGDDLREVLRLLD
jgi:phosphoglycolate phosphatase-like HAD superfamily hydrolase